MSHESMKDRDSDLAPTTDCPEGPEEDIAEFLADYVDRFATGEVAGPWDHLAARPESPSDFIEALDTIASVNSVYDETTVPAEFGEFRILREIGRGGMGIVYEARQRSLGRDVALKVMPARLISSRRAVARFTREARVAAGLYHPNIVGVYSMGVEGGTPYYAMELSDGETLERILARIRVADLDRTPAAFRRTPGRVSSILRRLLGRLKSRGSGEAPGNGARGSHADRAETSIWSTTVSRPAQPGGALKSALALDSGEERSYFVRLAGVFAGAAEGLQYAHERGVIHRDLKPSNLVLNERGVLRVLDFGVARVEGLGRLTFSDERVGTPLYMSPEQAQDPPGPIGPGTDIYSLGATMYEMLVLAPPHRGASTQDTLRKIAEEDSPPPRKLNPHVPRDLETIVLQCLRKDPRKRYGSAEALAGDLRNFLEGKPLVARPQPLAERFARRTWQARRTLLRGAGVLAVVAGIAVLVSSYLYRAHLVKVERFEGGLEAGLGHLLRQQLRVTAPRLITGGAEIISTGARDPERPIESRESDGSSQVQGASPGVLEAGLALARIDRDHLAEAEAAIRSALGIFGNDVTAKFYLARVLSLEDRLTEALAELEIIQETRPGFVPALALRARVLERQGSSLAPSAWAEAERCAKESSQEWERFWLAAYRALWDRRWGDAAGAFTRLQPWLSAGKEPYVGARRESLMWSGIARLRSGSREAALEDFRAANYAWSHNLEAVLFLGQTRYLNGQVARAHDLFEAFLETAIPRGTPSVNEVVAAVVGVYKDLGDDAAVLRWIDRMAEGPAKSLARAEALARGGRFAEARRLALDVSRNGNGLAARLTLGNIQLLEGKLDEALTTFGLAGKRHPGDPRPLLGEGVCLANLGRPSEAEARLREAIQMRGGFAPAHYNLGQILDRQGKLDEAIVAYERALELNPFDPNAINNLGSLHDRQGDLYLAREHYREAVAGGPTLVAARFNLGWLFHRERRYFEAAREYRQAIELGIDSDFVHGLLASALLRGRGIASGPTQIEIGQLFEEAIRRKSDYPTNYFDFGVYELWAGNHGEAARRFREYLAMEPADSIGWSHLGQALDRDGRTDEAIEAFREALKVDRRNIVAQNHLADLLLRDDRLPRGQRALRQAIVELEDASRLEFAWSEIRTLLERCRKVLDPALASHNSVDDALAMQAGDATTAIERGRELLLLPGGEEGLEPPQRAYLRGRLHQLAGDLEAALVEFEAAGNLDPLRPEPSVRAAECLDGLGARERAEALLRRVLDGSTFDSGVARHDPLWDAWLGHAFRTRGRRPEEILASFPLKEEVVAGRAHDHARDILWLVERLAAGEPLRINCGGKDYATEGFTWGQDRFFRHGHLFYLRDLDELYEDRDDAALYRTERFFWVDRETEAGKLRPGYRVPLPAGRYRVSLHFVEGHLRTRGSRVFDVLLEKEPAISSYEPLAAGFGKVDIVHRDIVVEDGALDLDFRAIAQNPKLSAFEIRRAD